MRILMMSDFYHPIVGGLERHVRTLSHELVRRGHDVSVATLGREGSPAFELDSGISVYRIAGWNRVLGPFYASKERQFHPTMPDPGVMASLRRVMALVRPDIVHARGWMLYSYLPLKRRYPAKLVVTLHDYSLVCPKKSYMRRGRVCDGPSYGKCVRCAVDQYGLGKSLLLTTGLQVSKGLHGRVDQYIAVSQAVAKASVLRAGHPSRPVEVIPTFVPDAVFDSSSSRGRPAFLPPDDGYILFVGEFARHKGVQVLLEAYKGLEAIAPLVLIGTEHGTSTLQFPPGVTVARNVPHADVMAAWEHCAIGVVPSIWPDPLPQVAIEAMACAKPVVASAVGGLPDLVLDGETGLLVPPSDVTSLHDALQTILLDSGRRHMLGESARQHARQFTVGVVADQIEQMYDRIQGGGHHALKL